MTRSTPKFKVGDRVRNAKPDGYPGNPPKNSTGTVSSVYQSGRVCLVEWDKDREKYAEHQTARELELIGEENCPFKPGDRVRNKETGKEDIVKWVPGMREYDRREFICANEGFVLKRNSWDLQRYWELAPEEKVEEKIDDRVSRLLAHDFARRTRVELDEVFYQHWPNPPFGDTLTIETPKTKSIMSSIIEKARMLVMPEPEKSFIKAGIMTQNRELTHEGKVLFTEFLLGKFGAEFKKEVVDPILAEEKNSK